MMRNENGGKNLLVFTLPFGPPHGSPSRCYRSGLLGKGLTSHGTTKFDVVSGIIALLIQVSATPLPFHLVFLNHFAVRIGERCQEESLNPDRIHGKLSLFICRVISGLLLLSHHVKTFCVTCIF